MSLACYTSGHSGERSYPDSAGGRRSSRDGVSVTDNASSSSATETPAGGPRSSLACEELVEIDLGGDPAGRREGEVAVLWRVRTSGKAAEGIEMNYTSLMSGHY